MSLDTPRYGGIAAPDLPVRRVEVRGRARSIEVVATDDPTALLLATAMRSNSDRSD